LWEVQIYRIAPIKMFMSDSRSPVQASERLVELVYELLDAHDDTARLAQELGRDVQWAAHLDYLQQLQRVGRELLAADTLTRAAA
jgi:hypothetical protein